jgi:F-type H+-transporting ATPase subunit b
MPQFDLANFVPQLVWLTIFFAVLYFGIVRLTLPKLAKTMDAREGQVANDIATAERAKGEADQMAAT